MEKTISEIMREIAQENQDQEVIQGDFDCMYSDRTPDDYLSKWSIDELIDFGSRCH